MASTSGYIIASIYGEDINSFTDLTISISDAIYAFNEMIEDLSQDIGPFVCPVFGEEIWLLDWYDIGANYPVFAYNV